MIPIRLHDTWDGVKHEPGDAVYSHVTSQDGTHRCAWDNCDGRHLFVVCPNGVMIDLMARAANCGRKDDRTHRCWVIHNIDGKLTVDKSGDTCDAGAGSIAIDEVKNAEGRVLVAGWHGFIRNHELIDT